MSAINIGGITKTLLTINATTTFLIEILWYYFFYFKKSTKHLNKFLSGNIFCSMKRSAHRMNYILRYLIVKKMTVRIFSRQLTATAIKIYLSKFGK